MEKLRVGIVGVSGYGGGEVARLLAQHPHIELTYVTSGTYAGKPLSHALPGVAKRIDLVCETFEPNRASELCDFVFFAGEAGMAMKVAPDFLAAGKKIVDLSADFRLHDASAYNHWYRLEHTAIDLLANAVYGLPELHRDAIRDAKLVANPGCYPTSAILALTPLLTHQLIDIKTIIVDSMSGVSGAGRSKFSLDYHFSEVNESVRPYGVGGLHRHTPEIEQEVTQVADQAITLTFTPHLIPITRGILTTAYANLLDAGVNLGDLYREFYRNEPFVVVMEDGQYPATKYTEGTNYCYLGVTTDKRTGRAIVISAIDNLVKGAAGQAVQNMNLMCGFEETAGLTMAAVWP